MLNRLRRAVLGAILIATTVFAVAPVTPALALAHQCLADNNTHHSYLLKNGVGRIDDVEADVEVGPVEPCIVGSWGASMVLPLNLEHDPAGFLAQFGYIKFGGTTRIEWVYTPNVCSRPEPGVVIIAPGISKPVLGHTYHVHMSYVSSSARFRVWVDDYADGIGNPQGLWFDANPCLTYGNQAWAGFEVGDGGDTLGGDGQWVSIENLTYEVQGSGTSIYWTDSNGTEFWSNQGVFKPYWHDQRYTTTNNRSAIRAYTS